MRTRRVLMVSTDPIHPVANYYPLTTPKAMRISRSFTHAEEDPMQVRNNTNTLRVTVACAIMAGTLMVMPAANARAADVGVRMGYYFDADAFSIGTELLTPLGDNTRQWYFNPNAEVAMADFHYDFDTGASTAVWAGAGPALLIRDHVSENTDVDPALNLILGFGAKNGAYRPFIQGKGILSNDSEAALAVGIRF
jgi:hypothetical protein